jgi:hypothetical protein
LMQAMNASILCLRCALEAKLPRRRSLRTRTPPPGGLHRLVHREPLARRCVSLATGTTGRVGPPPMDYRHKPP